jgi:hypothetical protein
MFPMPEPDTYSLSPTQSFAFDVLAAREQEAVRLVEEAIHLRMHGERAPGGTENWRDWERAAEVFMRSLSGPMREDGDRTERQEA